ncbi:tail assembly protein [Chromobacterium haemolyticum]|uniref:tail assembly protein n=1 Tax=Chromobacterium haemolyticum TaxID=394935 RepID=UPI0009DA1961|nr:tail assembly protein [Chromobacterium haemolyticum]
MSELRTVRLGGDLGRCFGGEHRLAVRSVGETVVALNALYPGFNNALRAADEAGLMFRVTVADRDVSEGELNLVSSGDILIMPEIVGAGGAANKLLGAVLIVAGALTWYMGGTSLMAVGAGLMLGGAMMLLTPVPKMGYGQGERQENKPSYLFNGAANSSAQGMPAPWGCGRHRVGGIVVSAGVSVEDL